MVLPSLIIATGIATGLLKTGWDRAVGDRWLPQNNSMKSNKAGRGIDREGSTRFSKTGALNRSATLPEKIDLA